MARLIDLAGVEESKPQLNTPTKAVVGETDDRPNPNIGLVSAALSCYPIASQLALYLDLNSLHELSRTCRQVRANLLQYRSQLIASALRCENSTTSPALRLGNALDASHRIWTTYGQSGIKIGRITSGKVGACARDMVGECRRCSKIVCRNCIVKAPSTAVVRERHQRLCRTCMKSPLDRMTTSTRLPCASEDISKVDDEPSLLTISHTPCTCDVSVWICQPCGQSLRAMNTSYLRGWVWRNRYSTSGGLGAGLGEGNEGVECGRGKACLAAKEVFKEIECDPDELDALELEMMKAEMEGRQWKGSSYHTQEIVGIGGNIKKKVRKKVLVGAAVKEYEDERETGQFLSREQKGQNRSWCSWCERVVLGEKDFAFAGTRSTDSIASDMSSASV